MKIILDINLQQIHYLKTFIGREMHDINKNEDHEDCFTAKKLKAKGWSEKAIARELNDYKEQLTDILKQLK